MSKLTKEQFADLPALVAEATPGPWKVCETSIHGRKYGGCWVEGPDEEDDNGNLHGALIPLSGSHGSKSYTTRLVDRQDHDHNDANARLIALAPSLAATVIEQQAEIDRLRKALEWYANPAIYAPHPHGPAFDRRDVSYVALAALEGKL